MAMNIFGLKYRILGGYRPPYRAPAVGAITFGVPTTEIHTMKRRNPARWINLAEVQAQYKRMAPRVKHMNTVQLYCTAKSTACYGTC